MKPPRGSRTIQSGTRKIRQANVLTGALFLFYAWELPPWLPRILVYEGADSWRTVFCHFAGGKLQVGVDLLYTAGPLAYLRQPYYCAQTWWLSIAWSLLQALALALVYRRLFSRSQGPVAVASWVLFLTLPFFDGTPGTGIYFALLVFTFYREAERTRPRLTWSDAVLALTLAIGSWVIFTRFVATVALVTVGAGVYFLRFRRVSPFAGLYALLLALVWTAAGQHPSSLIPYLVTSWEIASGYGEVMASSRPLWEVWVALAGIAVMAACLIASRQLWDSAWVRWALFAGTAGIFWIVFRTSFIRHTRPRISMVAMVLLALAIILAARYLRSGDRLAGRKIVGLALATGLAVGFAFMGSGSEGGVARYLRSQYKEWTFTDEGIKEHLRGLPNVKARDRASGERVRSKLEVPPLQGTVDLFGWDAGSVVALGFDYRPRPVFQNYLAFTERLAEINASFYRSDQAPEIVLMNLKRLSGYPTSLLDSRALLELLASYEITDTYGSLLRLDRLDRKARRPCDLEPVLIVRSEQGDWINLGGREDQSPLWVEVDVEPTLFGRGVAFVYKPSLLQLTLELASGNQETYRFAAVAGRGGFLLSPLLRHGPDFERLSETGLRGPLAGRAVRRFRIEAAKDAGRRQYDEIHVEAYAVHGCVAAPVD